MPAQSLSHVHLIATPGTVAFWAFYTHRHTHTVCVCVCVCVYTEI